DRRSRRGASETFPFRGRKEGANRARGAFPAAALRRGRRPAGVVERRSRALRCNGKSIDRRPPGPLWRTGRGEARRKEESSALCWCYHTKRRNVTRPAKIRPCSSFPLTPTLSRRERGSCRFLLVATSLLCASPLVAQPRAIPFWDDKVPAAI